MALKGQFFLRDPQHPGWNMSHGELRRLLGVKSSKLPTHSIPAQLIQGILVWVRAPIETGTRPNGRKVKSSEHRVMARCPACEETVSAGRMHQHVCKTGVGRLMAEAAATAKARGHRLGAWDRAGDWGWFAACTCGCDVQVLPKPLPNEIDIGGTAVALNCMLPKR